MVWDGLINKYSVHHFFPYQEKFICGDAEAAAGLFSVAAAFRMQNIISSNCGPTSIKSNNKKRLLPVFGIDLITMGRNLQWKRH